MEQPPAHVPRMTVVPLKVLLDVNVSREFGMYLADAIGLDAVFHSVDEGWHMLENGSLQRAAVAKDYTHLVTHDTDMAQKHAAHMPVIAIDNPDHGDMGREHWLSDDQIREHRMALAMAVGDELLDRPPLRHDYYAVRTPGCRPRKALQRILDGRHRQSPDHERNRQRRIAEQQAKAGTKKGHGIDR